MLIRWRSSLVCTGLAVLLGCEAPPLPNYPALTAPAALDILNQRSAAIHTFTARCELTLVRGDNQTVQLDGLLAMSPPDRLRLRVWKFDQAVFDLTLLPDGLWVETSPDADRHGPVLPAALSAAQLAHFLTWFQGGFFTAPGLIVQPSAKETFTFRRNQSDGASVFCDVDKATVTPREFRLVDKAGKTRFTLAMSDFRDMIGIVWPIHLSAVEVSSTGAGSKIDIVFKDLNFNEDLAPQAFVPPPTAEKRP